MLNFIVFSAAEGSRPRGVAGSAHGGHVAALWWGQGRRGSAGWLVKLARALPALLAGLLVGCAGAPFDTVDFRRAGPEPDGELRVDPADVDHVAHTFELDLGSPVEQPSGLHQSQGTLTLWTEYRGAPPSAELLCRQRIEIQGVATQGLDVAGEDCPSCTAELVFDPATAEDVSDPLVAPRECALGSLQDVDVGMRLLSPPSAGGHGDVLRLLLLDGEVAAAADWSPTLDGSVDVVGVSLELANQGFRFVGFLLVQAGPGSRVAASDLADLATPVGAAPSWYGFFSLAQPQDTPPVPLLEGWLAGSGLWRLPVDP